MKTVSLNQFIKIALINFLLVAILGLLMRYKIVFSLPFLDQKNLLHAHSHFAFAGWVSLLLMTLLVKLLEPALTEKQGIFFKGILLSFLICSYGMLFSFAWQGYKALSITFSTLSILLGALFAFRYYFIARYQPNLYGKQWIFAALFFQTFAALGTFYLSYMMATKNIDQHHYLASIYWYLHFQYNGWFLFACIGLFINLLRSHHITLKNEGIAGRLMIYSCIPCFGLSVLWMKLPVVVFIFLATGTLAQLAGWVLLVTPIFTKKIAEKMTISPLTKFLFLFALFACSIKILLQTGSVIPSLSQWAFGFRPIVIAYLHLVLLAFISIFLIGYLHATRLLLTHKAGVYLLVSGIVLNESLLALQGMASISMILIPYNNELLLAAAGIIVVGLSIMVFTRKKIIST